MNRYPDIRRNHPVRLSHPFWPVSGLTSESVRPSHAAGTVVMRTDCMTGVMRLLTVAGAAHVGLLLMFRSGLRVSRLTARQSRQASTKTGLV